MYTGNETLYETELTRIFFLNNHRILTCRTETIPYRHDELEEYDDTPSGSFLWVFVGFLAAYSILVVFLLAHLICISFSYFVFQTQDLKALFSLNFCIDFFAVAVFLNPPCY